MPLHGTLSASLPQKSLEELDIGVTNKGTLHSHENKAPYQGSMKVTWSK